MTGVDWEQEVQAMADDLLRARANHRPDDEIAEIMYTHGDRLKFLAQVELGEFEPEATGNAV